MSDAVKLRPNLKTRVSATRPRSESDLSPIAGRFSPNCHRFARCVFANRSIANRASAAAATPSASPKMATGRPRDPKMCNWRCLLGYFLGNGAANDRQQPATRGVARVLVLTAYWGDGQVTKGSIVADPKAGFDVIGSYTYPRSGVFRVTAQVGDTDGDSVSVSTSNVVTEAVITGTGAKIQPTKTQSLLNVVVATFTDADPFLKASDFSATINWGDGQTSPGAIMDRRPRPRHSSPSTIRPPGPCSRA
jgi:hypothetical protein